MLAVTKQRAVTGATWPVRRAVTDVPVRSTALSPSAGNAQRASEALRGKQSDEAALGGGSSASASWVWEAGKGNV